MEGIYQGDGITYGSTCALLSEHFGAVRDKMLRSTVLLVLMFGRKRASMS